MWVAGRDRPREPKGTGRRSFFPRNFRPEETSCANRLEVSGLPTPHEFLYKITRNSWFLSQILLSILTPFKSNTRSQLPNLGDSNLTALAAVAPATST